MSRSHAILLGLALVGCVRDGDAVEPSEVSRAAANPVEAGQPSETADPQAIDSTFVGSELPAELLGELRDPDGRIVVLAPGFVAASACVDCGAPSYLWFLAVRCTDTTHCEVLTERCQGRIESSGLDFTLALAPVEGDASACKDYSGSFTKQTPK